MQQQGSSMTVSTRVDLLLSTYGPTLSVISQNWPVYSSTPDADGRDQLLRPEDALALAREEIVDLRRSRLVGKAAKVDALTDSSCWRGTRSARGSSRLIRPDYSPLPWEA